MQEDGSPREKRKKKEKKKKKKDHDPRSVLQLSLRLQEFTSKSERGRMPRNLKSLYAGYKLITCLTSPTGAFCLAKSFCSSPFFFFFSSFLCLFFFIPRLLLRFFGRSCTSSSLFISLGFAGLRPFPSPFFFIPVAASARCDSEESRRQADCWPLWQRPDMSGIFSLFFWPSFGSVIVIL